MYELTSFLTTIAAASASIVAILGGFIASRLISLNSDRESSIERLNQIEEELKMRIAEKDKLQKENEEDDALEFITEHISDLIKGKSLSDIYNDSERTSLPQGVLSVYWEKAIQICSKYYSAINAGSIPRNSDNIPKVLAQEYSNDDFSYDVCLEINYELQERIDAQKREESRINDGLLGSLLEHPYIPDMSTNIGDVDGPGYIKNNELIAEQNSTITFLKLQRDQLISHINSLKEPKGMKAGLVIFALFSVACIICPLAFIPYSTANLVYYRVVKYIFLALFSGGLLAIFVYLVNLLGWKDKGK